MAVRSQATKLAKSVSLCKYPTVDFHFISKEKRANVLWKKLKSMYERLSAIMFLQQSSVDRRVANIGSNVWKALWKTPIPLKMQILLWQIILDRLPTKETIVKHHWEC